MKQLSILVPARNEEFLQQTIDDIFLHSELGDKLEILVGLDGWHTKLKKRPNLRVFESTNVLGQRATQNALAGISEAKYIMKLDAHVSVSQGFDKVMLEIMEANPNIVLVPALGNLHVYDWLCPLKHRTYQGKVDKCSQCDSTDLKKELVWKIESKLYSDFYFDKDLIFQFGDVDNYEMLHETMMIQGSGFVVSKSDYFKHNLCDESFGSWGQQGYEVWKKTIDNGGKVFSTRRAFMGPFFRKIDEFPYLRDQEQIDMAYRKSKELALKK